METQTGAEIPQLIKTYLQQVKVMQLATSHNSQPWAVNVHFAFNDKLNLYWMSTKERRHSRESKDRCRCGFWGYGHRG